MRAGLGGGWTIHHLTDRSIEIRKEDWTYRRYTGRDGVVRLRAEPGMDRHQLLDKALRLAHETDAALSQKVATELMPTGRQWAAYRQKQRQMARVFGTPEDVELIGRKRV